MIKEASITTRIAYCLALLGGGLVSTDFVAASSGLIEVTPAMWNNLASGLIRSLLIGVIVIYRFFAVIRCPHILDAPPPASPFVKILRNAGLFLIYVGAIYTILAWCAALLVYLFTQPGTGIPEDSSLAGILKILDDIGGSGVLLYEVSRLRGFEQQQAAGEVTVAAPKSNVS